jgi:hypothetical protein
VRHQHLITQPVLYAVLIGCDTLGAFTPARVISLSRHVGQANIPITGPRIEYSACKSSHDRIFCMHDRTPSSCSSYARVHQLKCFETTYNTFAANVSTMNNFDVTCIAEQVSGEVLGRSRSTLCQQSARMANFLRRIRVISLKATKSAFDLRSHTCDIS